MCDDGNTVSDDGCSSWCQLETEEPMIDCAAIHAEVPSSPSGRYDIYPDGDEDSKVTVWCDMETAGGGWTQIYLADDNNLNDTKLDYTVTASELRSTEFEAMIAYMPAAGGPLTAPTRFAMPQHWVDAAPMTYDQGETTVTLLQEGDATLTQGTLKYGGGSFMNNCTAEWGTLSWGRICIEGTNAPFYASFNQPTDDTCSLSTEHYTETDCSDDRRFAILVRRPICGNGQVELGEGCEPEGENVSGCTYDCRTYDIEASPDCLAILDATPGVASGHYTIDPEGPGTGAGPTTVYCDMETQGGGWTYCGRRIDATVLEGPDSESVDWQTRSPGEGDNWHACHRIPDADQQMRIDGSTSAEAGTSKTWFFPGLSPLHGGQDMQAALGEDALLDLSPDYLDTCQEAGKTSGHQFRITSFGAVLGVEPPEGCGITETPQVFVQGSGFLSCAPEDTLYPPYINGNCLSSDGVDNTTPVDVGLDLDLFVRRGTCGDGVLDPTEACDDGNASHTDGCTSTCVNLDTPAAYAEGLADCVAIQALVPSAASGVYLIDPDGPGGDAPIEVHCDMVTDGGGWTRIFIAQSDNYESVNFAYSPNSDALLATNTAVMIGFADAWLPRARFAMPASWLTVPPMTHENGGETVDVAINGEEVLVPAELKYGWGGYFDDCEAEWSTSGFAGRICLSGTEGPYWSSFADVTIDYCNDSSEGFDAQSCGEDKRFAIQVRRPVCGNGRVEIGESCDDQNDDNTDGCSTGCQPYAGGAADCRQILEEIPSAKTGHYIITPDGLNQPTLVHCDMTTDGGGWTRCAKQHTHTPTVLNWQGEDSDKNWYACHDLANEVGATRVVASNDLGDSQAWHFEGSNPVQGSAGLSDTTGQVQLSIYKDSAHGTCPSATTADDNYQVMVTLQSALFGLEPGNTCASGDDELFLFGRGVHGNGCTQAGQLVPNLAYPCGFYTDQAFAFEVLHRRSICGDGVVEPGEACDDGNQEPADGCVRSCEIYEDPVDCADILEQASGAPSGFYTIDPDGNPATDPIEVWCDMEIDHGGWTRIYVAQSDVLNSTTLPYTVSASELRAGAGLRAMIAYMPIDGGEIVSPTRFPLPAKWITAPPMTYEREDEEDVMVMVGDDTQPSPATLRYGYDDAYGTCEGAWMDETEPMTLPTWGRICVQDTAAPFWNGFAGGTSLSDVGWDLCSLSGQLWNDTPCSAARSFAIFTRRPTCGDGHIDFWEDCDDMNQVETDGCASTCVLASQGTDCQDVLSKKPWSTSGTFSLDPDGVGGQDVASVDCDMSTDGGGWSRVLFAETEHGQVEGLSLPSWAVSQQGFRQEGMDVLMAYTAADAYEAQAPWAIHPIIGPYTDGPAPWNVQTGSESVDARLWTTLGVVPMTTQLNYGSQSFAQGPCASEWEVSVETLYTEDLALESSGWEIWNRQTGWGGSLLGDADQYVSGPHTFTKIDSNPEEEFTTYIHAAYQGGELGAGDWGTPVRKDIELTGYTGKTVTVRGKFFVFDNWHGGGPQYYEHDGGAILLGSGVEYINTTDENGSPIYAMAGPHPMVAELAFEASAGLSYLGFSAGEEYVTDSYRISDERTDTLGDGQPDGVIEFSIPHLMADDVLTIEVLGGVGTWPGGEGFGFTIDAIELPDEGDGRICLEGTDAPYWSGWNNAQVDHCSVSSEDHDSSSCSDSRRFGLWTRRTCEGEPDACPGASGVPFELVDFQDDSGTTGQSLSMESLLGEGPVLVALLSGSDAYCQSQATKLETFQTSLEALGTPVTVVVIHTTGGEAEQGKLTDKCSFPLLQDTAEQDVWGDLGGSKDDLYIYTSGGVLHTYLPSSGPVSTDLSTTEGYDNVTVAILAAIED
jgi:cysteine-rich repeat protein